MLWAAGGLWLVLGAMQPQDDAWESAVCIGTAALALLAPLGLFMAWLARAMGRGPLPAQAADCSERMQAIGRLSGPFAHELNNLRSEPGRCVVAALVLPVQDASVPPSA